MTYRPTIFELDRIYNKLNTIIINKIEEKTIEKEDTYEIPLNLVEIDENEKRIKRKIKELYKDEMKRMQGAEAAMFINEKAKSIKEKILFKNEGTIEYLI